MTQPFRTLGLQQIAARTPDAGLLQTLWHDIFGLAINRQIRWERENVNGEICVLGHDVHEVEADLIKQIKPVPKAVLQTKSLDRVRFWVDDLPKAVEWMTTYCLRLATGGGVCARPAGACGEGWDIQSRRCIKRIGMARGGSSVIAAITHRSRRLGRTVSWQNSLVWIGRASRNVGNEFGRQASMRTACRARTLPSKRHSEAWSPHLALACKWHERWSISSLALRFPFWWLAHVPQAIRQIQRPN